MIRIDTVIARIPGLDEPLIADWIARGWVHAEGEGRTEWVFTEIDIARLHLLHDLRVDMALDEETLPLVLSLLDQVYDLRWTLRTVLDVIGEAPDDVRRRVVAALTQDK
jgi:chaperone modulatory protein CbpM